jgi:Family of unknown function (DUF5686)
MNRSFIFTALLLIPTLLLSQISLKGRVVSNDGEPLAFVSIIAQADDRKVAFSDIEGGFSLPIKGRLQSLTFRYVGFQELILTDKELRVLDLQQLNIVLKPTNNALTTVDIIAGENPADILMRKVIANRHRNNPERNNSYICKTYNKVALDALPNRAIFEKKAQKEKEIKGFEHTERTMQRRHLFFMESVTERSFLAPNLTQEKVLLNRVSGFQDAALVTLANAVQPFTFYGDFLPIMDKKFVNPVSPGSTKLYYFSLEDTLFTDKDTIWVLRFKPRKGKVFMALKGTLHIHSRYYAVQNVIANPAFGNENINMTLEQAYTFVPIAGDSGQWFPQQLNFELMAARYPSPEMGAKATGHSFISEVQPFAPLKIKDFNPEQPLTIQKNAATRDSLLWMPWRKNLPMSERERNTYLSIDSIGTVKKFDRWAKIISALNTGVWPLYPGIGLQLGSIIRLNEYEGARLGVGFTNAQHRPLELSKKYEWGVGSGWGFRDQQLKYNGYALWRIHRGWQTQLRFDLMRDLLEPGAPYEFNTGNFFNRGLYAQRMDLALDAALRFSTRIGKLLTTSLTARQQTLRPSGYEYTYQKDENTPSFSQFRFKEVTAVARLAYGEQLRSFMGNNTTVQRWPVVEIASTIGAGEHQYQRYLAAVYQSFFIPRLGYCQWRIEAGMAKGNTPLAKLFTLNQNAGAYSSFAVGQTFQSLPDTLFLHDRFVNFFFEQEIGPVLYQRKYSSPFLSVIHNMAQGQLSKPTQHQQIGFLSMEQLYLESGLRLDNLVRFNYANFGWLGVGGALFYRWGAFASDHWKENISPRLSIKFTL